MDQFIRQAIEAIKASANTARERIERVRLGITGELDALEPADANSQLATATGDLASIIRETDRILERHT